MDQQTTTHCGCATPCGPAHFVAINYITVREDYAPRFEELFATRAHAIDRVPGFVEMFVLRPERAREAYLILSQWKNEGDFQAWVCSPEFAEGHQRGFADIKRAMDAGQEPPMTSSFQTYRIVAR
ncbi:MAG: antibiotic biosynthesis monooxygenase [Fimbriimonadaceae bacterium]|nr:Heme oxygenase (staphylobilin-producing) [Fimbriimonadaceae bacterium]MCC6351255.1 antibiotic biosynthesis monooxygenase [Fimbriimonadaceae bacterium]